MVTSSTFFPWSAAGHMPRPFQPSLVVGSSSLQNLLTESHSASAAVLTPISSRQNRACNSSLVRNSTLWDTQAPAGTHFDHLPHYDEPLKPSKASLTLRFGPHKVTCLKATQTAGGFSVGLRISKIGSFFCLFAFVFTFFSQWHTNNA